MKRTGARDDQLIASFKETGQTRFLDELFEPYVGMVRGMIYPMVLNDADADDLTQEIFIRAARGLARFRGHSRFSTWLYRVAMNAVHSFLRKRGSRPVVNGEAADDPPGPAKDRPDRSLMASELDAAIARALDELPPPFRASIVLTILRGVPVMEAARIENVTPATMYWRVHQARRRLKDRLGRYLT